jgi:hypothetical protein
MSQGRTVQSQAAADPQLPRPDQSEVCSFNSLTSIGWSLIWALLDVPQVRHTDRLADDGDKLEDMFGKCDIAGNRDFGTSRLLIDAFGKKTPCDRLRNGDVRGNGGRELTGESPTLMRSQKTPCAAALAGDFDTECCINFGRNVSRTGW